MNRSMAILTFALICGCCGPVRAQPAAPEQNIEQVIVTASRIPDQVKAFVRSYARRAQSGTPAIPRWKNAICPKTAGFADEKNNDFINSRLKEIAAESGVRLAAGGCRANIEIYFADQPQHLLDGILNHGGSLLLSPNTSKARQVAIFTQPVQAWYATATRDEYHNRITFDNTEDGGWSGCTCDITVPPPAGASVRVLGSDALRAGVTSEIAHVYIVVDARQMGSYPFSALADYIAFLALAEIHVLDKCQSLDTILNLLAAGCDAAKPAGLAEADRAYLKAIYAMDPGLAVNTLQDDIAATVLQALQKH